MDAKTKLHSNDGHILLEILPDQNLFGQGEHPNDLLSLAWEHEAAGLLIHASSLAPAFFNLKSGIAGEVLQKMVNYSCRAALIVPDLSTYDERIKELAHDHRRHPLVRFFEEKEDGFAWLQSH